MLGKLTSGCFYSGYSSSSFLYLKGVWKLNLYLEIMPIVESSGSLSSFISFVIQKLGKMPVSFILTG